jgi:uncharacterized lipoprotein YbaY
MEAAAGAAPAGPCPEPDLLGLYAERALDGDDQRHVEAHVATCDRCQATVAAFVRSAPEAAGAAGVGTGASTGWAWWSGWRWMVPATATAAMVALAVWVGRGPSERAAMAPPPDPAASAVSGNLSTEPTAPLREALDARAAPPQSAGSRPPAASEQQFARPAESPAAALPQARLERAQPAPQRQDAARENAFADQAAPAAPAPAAAPSVPPPPPPAAVQPPPASPPPPAPVASPGQRALGATAEPSPAEARERNAAPLAGAAATSRRQEAEAPRTADSSLAKATEAPMTALAGRITYRTRQALPAGATIEVQLLDVSRADAPATVLGRTRIVTTGEQVPIAFTIPYDATSIDARRRYTVQATITVGERVAFRTTTAHPVLSNGAPSTGVEVVVEPMR